MEEQNNYVVLVRGNHDNPVYFDERYFDDPRFRTVPDYTIVAACGHKVLCVGGAVSIDREYRKGSKFYHVPVPDEDPFMPNVWWPGEPPVFDRKKIDLITGHVSIDTVVTHTAPSFCEYTDKRGIEKWLSGDPTLLQDVTHERVQMDLLHSAIFDGGHPLQHWFYGHFHDNWHQEIDGVVYDMLGEHCLKEPR